MASDSVDSLHIFDCDGILLDSNKAKLEALREVLISVGAPITFVNWAAEEFRTNFGRTRKQHFDVFMRYECNEGFRLSSEKSRQAIQSYGERVELLYEKCAVIPETLSFILGLPADAKIFVVSASDESELRNILPSKIAVLKKQNIFGGPSSKIKNINKVIEIVGAKNAIFYGDAVQDARASMDSGVKFLGLSKYSADPSYFELFCSENNLDCVSSFSEVVC